MPKWIVITIGVVVFVGLTLFTFFLHQDHLNTKNKQLEIKNQKYELFIRLSEREISVEEYNLLTEVERAYLMANPERK